MFEVEPQPGNLQGAHVSRAIVHVWVFAADMQEARDAALRFFESDSWDVKEEKQALLLTPEQIDALSAADAASYHTAKAEGMHATFNYWHK